MVPGPPGAGFIPQRWSSLGKVQPYAATCSSAAGNGLEPHSDRRRGWTRSLPPAAAIHPQHPHSRTARCSGDQNRRPPSSRARRATQDAAEPAPPAAQPPPDLGEPKRSRRRHRSHPRRHRATRASTRPGVTAPRPDAAPPRSLLAPCHRRLRRPAPHATKRRGKAARPAARADRASPGRARRLQRGRGEGEEGVPAVAALGFLP